ncbi:MAG: hypothetical protein H7144_12450 [Burkholderiales bacterium]|nr:hypothetical protein [Phycisphaerae bacterium]
MQPFRLLVQYLSPSGRFVRIKVSRICQRLGRHRFIVQSVRNFLPLFAQILIPIVTGFPILILRRALRFPLDAFQFLLECFRIPFCFSLALLHFALFFQISPVFSARLLLFRVLSNLLRAINFLVFFPARRGANGAGGFGGIARAPVILKCVFVVSGSLPICLMGPGHFTILAQRTLIDVPRDVLSRGAIFRGAAFNALCGSRGHRMRCNQHSECDEPDDMDFPFYHRSFPDIALHYHRGQRIESRTCSRAKRISMISRELFDTRAQIER